MRRVLHNFGHLVKSMIVRDRAICEMEFDIVSKYCAGTLEKLYLGINFPFNVDSMKPVFASLKELQIPWEYFDGMIKECGILKVLKTSFDHKSGFEQNIPTLEELSICDMDEAGEDDQTIKNLLQLNPQIKKLSMLFCNVNEMFCSIAPKMEKLEELRMDMVRYDPDNYENIIDLGKLKTLKVLELREIAEEFHPIIIEAMQNVPVERFKWHGCLTNLEFINNMQNLKTLKSVALTFTSKIVGKLHFKIKEKLPFFGRIRVGIRRKGRIFHATI